MTDKPKPCPLSAVRPNLIDSADLAWYWDGSRESALGLRSSWEALCARAQGAAGGLDPESFAEDRRVEAALRARKIESKLFALSRRHQQVLRAVYSPTRLRAQYFAPYQEVALLVPAGRGLRRRGLERLSLLATTGKADAAHKASAESIRLASRALVLEAHRYYASQ